MTRALFVLLAACTEPYVYVSVEGSDPELVVAPVGVEVGVYGGRKRLDFQYIARMSPAKPGGVPATDFVLTIGELASEAQLRVLIPTTTANWFADARFSTQGDLQLPLFTGERAVATASFSNGDLDTSVLFGPGIAIAWVDTGGVQSRIERDPDELISRAEIVAPDPNAKGLRLTSRPNLLGYGPDLYALGWIGGDGMARVRTASTTQKFAARVIASGIDELSLGGALKGAPFAVAIATRSGSTMRLATVDDSGMPTPTTLGTGILLSGSVTAMLGVVVTRESIVVGWRDNAGSHLTLVGFDGTQHPAQMIDGDLLALSLTNDYTRVLTLQRRGLQLYQVTYFATLDPTGVEVALGATSLGSRAALSGCLAVWPEARADGGNAIDLRFVVLDPDGKMVSESHVLNAEDDGDHVAPTAVCASQTRAYATFFQRAALTDTTARLRIRRIPTY